MFAYYHFIFLLTVNVFIREVITKHGPEKDDARDKIDDEEQDIAYLPFSDLLLKSNMSKVPPATTIAVGNSPKPVKVSEQKPAGVAVNKPVAGSSASATPVPQNISLQEETSDESTQELADSRETNGKEQKKNHNVKEKAVTRDESPPTLEATYHTIPPPEPLPLKNVERPDSDGPVIVHGSTVTVGCRVSPPTNEKPGEELLMLRVPVGVKKPKKIHGVPVPQTRSTRQEVLGVQPTNESLTAAAPESDNPPVMTSYEQQDIKDEYLPCVDQGVDDEQSPSPSKITEGKETEDLTSTNGQSSNGVYIN